MFINSSENVFSIFMCWGYASFNLNFKLNLKAEKLKITLYNNFLSLLV